MKTKAEIANDFILLHKETDRDAWAPFHLSGDAKLEHIFNNILQGLYGECNEVDHLVGSGEYEIEIPSHNNRSGNPILFYFVDPDYKDQLVDVVIEIDKKELVDAVLEMIKQDAAAGDWEYVDKIRNCAFKAKLEFYTSDYIEDRRKRNE
jgi:hypothetical protein